MSTETKGHTPGPWACNSDGYVTACGQVIAQMGAVDDPDEAVSNGFLVEAAPDLLEACNAMVEWDAAENNARPYDSDGGAGFQHRMALCKDAFDRVRAAIAKATGSEVPA